MINLREFPESRYRHCYSVGLKMYFYAMRVFKWSENKCKEMFILGNLHDIGYYFDVDAYKHGDIFYEVSKDSYKYSREIKYHSKLQLNHLTDEMKLLYFADATVDGNGNWCTYEERLIDLETRYGKDSSVYKDTYDIIVMLKKWGFSDSLRLEKV